MDEDRNEYYSNLGWEGPYEIPTYVMGTKQELVNIYHIINQIRFVVVGQNKKNGKKTNLMTEIMENLKEMEAGILVRVERRILDPNQGTKKVITEDRGAVISNHLTIEEKSETSPIDVAIEEEEEDSFCIIQ